MPTSSACTIKSLASRGNPSFSARDLALFCADTAGGLARMKSRKSESETVFMFIKRPEQLHVRIMMILPTQIEDSYRIRCFLYKDSASKADSCKHTDRSQGKGKKGTAPAYGRHRAGTHTGERGTESSLLRSPGGSLTKLR